MNFEDPAVGIRLYTSKTSQRRGFFPPIQINSTVSRGRETLVSNKKAPFSCVGEGGLEDEVSHTTAIPFRNFFLAFSAPSAVFKGKSLKINFDDPVEPLPFLFRFIILHHFDAPSWLHMVPDTPLPGAAPQATFVRALRAHYFVLPFHNFFGKQTPQGSNSDSPGRSPG